MPVSVACPVCQRDGTAEADRISSKLVLLHEPETQLPEAQAYEDVSQSNAPKPKQVLGYAPRDRKTPP